MNPATGATIWASPIDDDTALQVAVAPSGVVLAECNRGMFAFDPASGSLRWHVKAYNNVGQQMVVTRTGTVVTTMLNQFGGNGGLQGLDTETGSVRWQMQNPLGQIWPFAAASDGTVYVAGRTDNTAKHAIFALDGVGGGQKWSYAPNFMFPAYGIILVGKDGTIYAVDHDNGDTPGTAGQPYLLMLR